jgi:uncharacterized membrane protein
MVMVSLSRLFNHFLMTGWYARRRFPPSTLSAIEAAIATAERKHGGEIRFAVESELSTSALLQDLSPRARALQVFGELGVWDTEHNNGVLIYVLLADHDVEIVADRGFTDKVSAAEWTAVCTTIEKEFRGGAFERGALAGIAAVSALVARHFPYTGRNELSNAPIVF